MRAKQRMQFRAKSAKNDLKPTDFLNHNFYFETEGVYDKLQLHRDFGYMIQFLHL